MSKLFSRHIFTSESVSEGHPDKVADQISDAILDEYLKRDCNAHVACETAVGPNIVMNLGEILHRDGIEEVNTEAVARGIVKDIGYDCPAENFSFDTFKYQCALHSQSLDINQGVDRGSPETQGAGDQGMMFGYASTETPEMMPATLVYSHRLVRRCAELRKNGTIPYLRPDAKAQVSILHDSGKPIEITTVVLSHQTQDVDITVIRRDLEALARECLADTGLITNKTQFLINPTGKFVIGGPNGDAGVTGRKIIVDTYGGVGAHGGGAFSGKDPSKVDRSAAYYARYAAKNLVAAGVADKCEIQVSYAIGVAKPTSINVSTMPFGKSLVSEEKIAEMLLNGDVFDFRPGMLVRDLGLLEPKGWCYRDTASYGHFGRAIFPWEKTDKVDAIREALGLKK